MNTITTQEITEKNTWENFVLNHPQANFLHSFNWGQFHLQLHHRVFRLGFYHGQKLVGVALFIHQPAKRGHHLECPGGPLLDWHNQALVTAFFAAAKTYGQKLKVGFISQKQIRFIRLRPQIPDTPENRRLLSQFHCRPAPIHLHAETTWQLDLNQSEDQILSQMRKSTRYSIRQADKLKLKVTPSQDIKDIDLLFKLQLQTVKRHHFTPFSKDFLKQQFEIFSSDNQALLLKASHQNQVLSVAFIIFYGQEAVYHYAGSSAQARQIPAAYAIQWAAIKEAKRRGLSRYNFWGIAPTDDPRHRFAGVTLFKTGFGGHRVDYLHAHDLPLKPAYWLTYLFETLRAKSRHL